MTLLDPTVVRQRLELHRSAGKPFYYAWKAAIEGMTFDPGRGAETLAFMRKHFEAAYHGNAMPEGRCDIPARETSAAIPKTPVEHHGPSDFETCRSGDRCDRPAVRGRFGRYWCDHHATELEALTLRMGLEAAQDHDRGSARQHEVAA